MKERLILVHRVKGCSPSRWHGGERGFSCGDYKAAGHIVSVDGKQREVLHFSLSICPRPLACGMVPLISKVDLASPVDFSGNTLRHTRREVS